jgi:hypothetical protein
LISLLEEKDRAAALQSLHEKINAGVQEKLDTMAANRVISMVNPEYDAAFALSMLGEQQYSEDAIAERNLQVLFQATARVEGPEATATNMGLSEIEKMEAMLAKAKAQIAARTVQDAEKAAQEQKERDDAAAKEKRRADLTEGLAGFAKRAELEEDMDEEAEDPPTRREKRAANEEAETETEAPSSRREKRQRTR